MMKLLLVCVAAAVACGACKRPEVAGVKASAPPEEEARVPRPALEPREFWLPLDHELAHYVEKYPGQPILVSISAKWSMTCTFAWRELFSDEATEALKNSGFVCLVGDVTEENEMLRREMTALGRVAVPVTAIYDPVDKAWVAKPDVFKGEDVREWVTSMKERMAKAAGDGGEGKR